MNGLKRKTSCMAEVDLCATDGHMFWGEDSDRGRCRCGERSFDLLGPEPASHGVYASESETLRDLDRAELETMREYGSSI